MDCVSSVFIGYRDCEDGFKIRFFRFSTCIMCANVQFLVLANSVVYDILILICDSSFLLIVKPCLAMTMAMTTHQNFDGVHL